MSQFLPVSSQQAGLDLSRALYDLAHPPAARLPSDVTTHFCGVVEDASGQWWLEIPNGEDLPVSPLVDDATLDAVVAQIEQQEADKDKLKADIRASKGGKLPISSLIPVKWKKKLAAGIQPKVSPQAPSKP